MISKELVDRFARFPLGVVKYEPVKVDGFPDAYRRTIDKSFFIHRNNTASYTCTLNGKEYTEEDFKNFDLVIGSNIYYTPSARWS